MDNSYRNIILTHPLRGNYGGMLQAASLCYIANLYARTEIVDYSASTNHATLRSYIRHAILFLLRTLRPPSLKNAIHYHIKATQEKRFKKLSKTCSLRNALHTDRKGVANHSWIVGSDQVWRAIFARNIRSLSFFFLDFVSEEVRRRSISYAASFGTDEWEGTPEETEECRKLLQQFKAVSVREHSGVKICRDVFGVDSVQMPDPTLLVEEGGYQHIIDSEITHQREEPYIAAYLLDESPGALEALRVVAEDLELPVQHLMPHANARHRRDRFPISVPQWLRYMKESSFVVTDSFHGCVFAIIFNKPFVCLGNEGRGSARFDTLFQTFHLESRLATSPEQAVAVAQAPIDWDAVNAVHEAERMRGLAFLRENLT